MNRSNKPSPKPLIAIVGETASGKSKLGMELARRFGGEIVAADSWTVYREFDIGTAKPSRVELNQVAHYMIDVVDACDGFNAAKYKELANEAIEEIHNRDKLPIMVGGTGLYVDSVVYDYTFLPPGDTEERQRLNALNIQELTEEAVREGISLVDVDTRNKRRIIRAIESRGAKPQKQGLRPNTLLLGVQLSREDLRANVEKRVDDMLQEGLREEVKFLADKYGWDVEPMRGIGYREWREYFMGTQSLEQTRSRIISATMQLAKRQRTWFKRNKRIQWVSDLSNAVDITTTFLNKTS